MKKTLTIMMAAMVIAGCGKKQEGTPAIDVTNLDTEVSPAVDFYKYATGGWSKKTPFKPEYSRYGVFDMLSEKAQEDLNAMFGEMAGMETEKGSVDQKIVDLYTMGLDSVRLNNEGGAPLAKYIAEIQGYASKKDMIRGLAASGLGGFFGGYVGADLMDSKMQIFYIGQGGLGMGDRDYYLDPVNAELKKGYQAFLAKVFALSGIADPEKAAANALSVEDKIALVSWTKEQNRDTQAQYNPMSTKQIISKYPGIEFAAFSEGYGIPELDKVIVEQPSFFTGLSDIIKSTDLAVLKDYVLGQFIQGACSYLSDDYVTANWDFFSRQMAGAKEQRPRWRRAMQVPNSILGEAVGKMYVERYFPESSKQKMEVLVANLRAALSEHIDALEWMGPETKAKAHEKLDNFTVKIGYPDKWKDYSSLDIDPALSYFDNIRAASAWRRAENLDKLGKPTDPTEWGMSPQTVNAYYDPTTNEICFPAAILQPPFFNPEADDAVNYGAIGVVIGHEISHGFDDQGRLFDAEGNMTNWWTPEDEAKFKELADVLVAQYDAVEVLPGVHANGRNTLGENIGDHGGLSIAFTAMENAIKDNRPGLIDGFTPEQRFYLAYATVWAQHITEQEIARRNNMDVHSIGVNRVNVAIRNFQSFFDAFGIKEGDPMYRPESERVVIW